MELLPNSPWQGCLRWLGGTVKRTADSLILQGNHIVNGNVFFEKVSNRLTGVQLYHIKEENMETYDAFLKQNLRQVPYETNTPGHPKSNQYMLQTVILLLQ